MEAYIQCVNNSIKNLTRFGKVIPSKEERIDVCKHFSCDENRAKFIVAKLMNDSNIKINIVKSAGETVNKTIEVIKEKAQEIKANDEAKQETKEEILTKKIKRKINE